MKKNNPSGLLLCNNTEIISGIVEAAEEVDIELKIRFDFSEIVLEIQEALFEVVILDCSDKDHECLNWIKVIKKINPNVPIVIVKDEIEKSLGSKLYEEKIFYLFIPPLNKKILRDVFVAALAQNEINI